MASSTSPRSWTRNARKLLVGGRFLFRYRPSRPSASAPDEIIGRAETSHEQYCTLYLVPWYRSGAVLCSEHLYGLLVLQVTVPAARDGRGQDIPGTPYRYLSYGIRGHVLSFLRALYRDRVPGMEYGAGLG